jgi:hypothetical protein
VFDQLSKGYRELDEDQDMVSTAQVCAMFVDWTDPQKAMYESDTTPCARLDSSSSLFFPEGPRVKVQTRWSIWSWQLRFFERSLTRIFRVSVDLALGSDRVPLMSGV